MNANLNLRKLQFSPFKICNVTQHVEIMKIFVRLRQSRFISYLKCFKDSIYLKSKREDGKKHQPFKSDVVPENIRIYLGVYKKTFN